MNQLELVVNSLSRLPGLGKKSATRMAYWLLRSDNSFNKTLGEAIIELQDKIISCSVCGNYTEEDPCPICSAHDRDRDLICVVEHPQDVMTIEATGEYRGLYHVLNGVLAPLDGVGPEELGLDRLVDRAAKEEAKEIIMATNPTLEGDSTALYIVRLFQDSPVKVTRIATGLPVGGDMEYADRLSIARSLRARQNLAD
ncbi:MAG: recombination mediator RecR [Spirochaetales bacterium]|nr:recombination mediator RecR [Spirochaetales bacterium]